MGIEFELKFSADPEDLQKIREDFGEFKAFSMESAYYDTPDGAFAAGHMTLRRRQENGRSVCTLKTPSTIYGRCEWEVEQERIEDAVLELCRMSGLEELERVNHKNLVQVCGASFTRLAKEVEFSGSIVELALDQGFLTGGGHKQPLCEVEVELKAGSEAAATAWAKSLAGKYGLRAAHKSKFCRALALAKGE